MVVNECAGMVITGLNKKNKTGLMLIEAEKPVNGIP
jgi:hypothetical protein